MAAKHWIPEALRGLAESLVPLPHEVNEIDWKARLSGNSARLAEHLMAFANHPGGGTLVFGVDDDGAAQGITAEEVAIVVGTLTNLGRDAVEPPLGLDHAAVEFGGSNVLLVRVKRNLRRIPPDFRFQLTDEAFKNLISQSVTSSWGGRRKLPLGRGDRCHSRPHGPAQTSKSAYRVHGGCHW